MSMHTHVGHRERLRQRFLAEDIHSFQPHEVLELILFYAIPRRDTNELAHALIQRFGSLSGVFEAQPADLVQVPGIGEQTAVLLALFGSTMSYSRRERFGDKPALTTRALSGQFCASLFANNLPIEHLYVVSLDSRYRVRRATCVQKGSLHELPVYKREIVAEVIRAGAAKVILAHNHPSGTLMPSGEDLAVTLELHKLFGDMQIALLDHVIVADGSYVSMDEMDLLRTYTLAHTPEGRIYAAEKGSLLPFEADPRFQQAHGLSPKKAPAKSRSAPSKPAKIKPALALGEKAFVGWQTHPPQWALDMQKESDEQDD